MYELYRGYGWGAPPGHVQRGARPSGGAGRFACTEPQDRVLPAVASRGVAQPGSAPALGAGGRRFESSRPDFCSKLARPAGFEPAASSLEGWRSIQLSYGRDVRRGDSRRSESVSDVGSLPTSSACSTPLAWPFPAGAMRRVTGWWSAEGCVPFTAERYLTPADGSTAGLVGDRPTASTGCGFGPGSWSASSPELPTTPSEPTGGAVLSDRVDPATPTRSNCVSEIAVVAVAQW